MLACEKDSSPVAQTKQPAPSDSSSVDIDSDGDGVPDCVDLCPKLAHATGEQSATGCSNIGVVYYSANEIGLVTRELFSPGTAELRVKATHAVASLASTLKSHPGMLPVSVEVRTGAQGSSAYNKSMTERRAVAVKHHFMEAGLPEAQVKAVGFGEEHDETDTNRFLLFRLAPSSCRSQYFSTVGN